MELLYRRIISEAEVHCLAGSRITLESGLYDTPSSCGWRFPPEFNFSDAITFRGRGGAERTHINCNGLPLIGNDSLVGLNILFEDMHISNALRTGAGAVVDAGSGSKVTIRSTRFTNCSSFHSGGVLRVSGGILQIQLSQFDSNSADLFGGSLAIADSATATVTDSSFTSNSAGDGGAMYVVSSSTLILNGVNVSECAATGNKGGAVYLDTRCQLSATRSLITKCVALRGGAINAQMFSTIRLDNSIISDNVANVAAGGVYVLLYSHLYLSDAVVIANCSTRLYGGGIFLYLASRLTAVGDVNITRCSANQLSGGLHMHSNTITFLHGIRIQDCSAYDTGGGAVLYGTNSQLSTLTATNVVFESNMAYGWGEPGDMGMGGGLALQGSHLNLYWNEVMLR